VIQHVTNAREFVSSLKQMAGKDGVIVITCPDGSLPNIELLWADQNFSFVPEHLVSLCKDIGFKTISWFASPFSVSVPPAQLLLLSENRHLHEARKGMDVPPANREALYQWRCEYLSSFTAIDDVLSSRTANCKHVFNFGASYWSSVLAAYCPRYWQQVFACLVDHPDTTDRRFLDKEVLELSLIQPMDADAIVFGTSPITHKALKKRFESSWKQVISWDHFSVQS
jgi:hypothetical protein